MGLKASEVLNLIRQLEASDGSNLSPRRPENLCFDPNPCVFREFWGVYRHNLLHSSGAHMLPCWFEGSEA